MICSAGLGLTFFSSACLFVSVVIITSLAYIFRGSFTGVVVTCSSCSGPGFGEPCYSSFSSMSLSSTSLFKTLFSDMDDALKLNCWGLDETSLLPFLFTSLIDMICNIRGCNCRSRRINMNVCVQSSQLTIVSLLNRLVGVRKSERCMTRTHYWLTLKTNALITHIWMM